MAMGALVRLYRVVAPSMKSARIAAREEIVRRVYRPIREAPKECVPAIERNAATNRENR